MYPHQWIDDNDEECDKESPPTDMGQLILVIGVVFVVVFVLSLVTFK